MLKRRSLMALASLLVTVGLFLRMLESNWLSGLFQTSENYFFSSFGKGVSGRTRAPTSESIFFNSPLLYKSVTISHPPTNSPPIKS